VEADKKGTPEDPDFHKELSETYLWWPEKIPNVELWQRGKQQPVGEQILRRKWGWIGHTLQKAPNSIAWQALRWNLQGERKRGRPRNS